MNSQKVETAQMSTNSELVDKLGFVPTVEYYAATKRNEVPSAMWVSLETLMLSVKKPDPRGQIVSESVYVKCPGKASPPRQEVDRWLLGWGWNEE